MDEGMHWKKVGAGVVALLLTFVPWAWPDMPGLLHLVVWPLVALGAAYWLQGWMNERRARGRMAIATPQLMIFIGLTIAAVGAAWELYRSATRSAGAPNLPVPVAGNPEAVLTVPKERHEIVWNPKRDPEIRIGTEGNLIEGRWTVPQFYLRATNNIAIQDATIEWRADMIGIAELLASSPRLTDNKVSIERDKVLIRSTSAKRPFGYDVEKSASYPIPFVTPNQPGAAAWLPLPVFVNAMLYAVAKLPDGLGSDLTPIPFTVTVSWTYPSPGRQQFSVVGTVRNVKPADVAEPLVNGVMTFAIRQVE